MATIFIRKYCLNRFFKNRLKNDYRSHDDLDRDPLTVFERPKLKVHDPFNDLLNELFPKEYDRRSIDQYQNHRLLSVAVSIWKIVCFQ